MDDMKTILEDIDTSFENLNEISEEGFGVVILSLIMLGLAANGIKELAAKKYYKKYKKELDKLTKDIQKTFVETDEIVKKELGKSTIDKLISEVYVKNKLVSLKEFQNVFEYNYRKQPHGIEDIRKSAKHKRVDHGIEITYADFETLTDKYDIDSSDYDTAHDLIVKMSEKLTTKVRDLVKSTVKLKKYYTMDELEYTIDGTCDIEFGFYAEIWLMVDVKTMLNDFLLKHKEEK